MSDAELIKKLQERVKKLEEEKATRDATTRDFDLKGAKDLLDIEMKMSEVAGDRIKLFQQASEMYRAMGLDEAAFAELTQEQQRQKLQEVAEQTGINVEQVRRLIEQQQQLGEVGTEAYKSMRSGAEDVATKLGLVSKKADGIVQGIVKIGTMAQSPEGIKGMALALRDTFKPSRMAASLALKIAEATFFSVLAIDAATAAMAKQTGMGRTATAGISRLALEHRNLGINAADAGKAFTAATLQIANFRMMSESTQQEVTLLAAGLEKLGVSSGTSMAMVENFRKQLNVTTTEAADLTRDLALTAKAIGVSMNKFVEGFKAANRTLAVYGAGAIKVFKNLSAAAKAANVEAETLLGLAGRFDTFSDAAETTGKLNAILGSQMSAMDLLTMKEDKRIETLIRSIQASGKQFSQMDRFTQKAIAQAAGISDMAEANKIFGMSFSEYRANQRRIDAQAKSQEELDNRMKEAMGIVEKLKNIMMEFAIKGIGPNIDKISDLAEKLANFFHIIMQGNRPLYIFIGALSLLAFTILKPFISLLMLASPLLKGIALGFLQAAAAIAKKVFGLKILIPAQETNIQQQKRSAVHGLIAAKAQLKLALAIGAVAASIGLAAAGLSLFVLQFGKLSPVKMILVTAAIVGLSMGFKALATALFALEVPAAGFAAAALGLAGAIAIVFTGMGLFSAAVGYLIEQLAALASNGFTAVGVLVALAGAAVALGFAAKFLANPLAMIGIGLLIGVMDKVARVAEAKARMAEATSKSIAGMGTMVGSLETQVEKMSSVMSTNFTTVFSDLLLSVDLFMSQLRSITGGSDGVQVRHTLENLALISTGTSARKLDGGTGSAIVNALNRIAGREDGGVPLKIHLDADDLKQLLRKGYFEIRAEP